MKIYITTIFTFLCIAAIISCKEATRTNGSKLKIVTTTSIIADGVRQIVGDSAEVVSLMGAGIDPHLYKASQGDVAKLSNADVIVYNGLHLEGKMTTVLEKMAKNKVVIAMSDGLKTEQLIVTNASAKTLDPHIWFDAMLWKQAMQHVGYALAKVDTIHRDFYISNTKKYCLELAQLHEWTMTEISKIPTQQRLIITAHDAFSYYGRTYHIEVKGLQGISTLSDFGLNDITSLVNLIVSRNIKSVFVETSVSPKSIEALVEGCKAKNHQVSIGGSLYSDALGDFQSDQGTYIGMFQYNTTTIVNSLH